MANDIEIKNNYHILGSTVETQQLEILMPNTLYTQNSRYHPTHHRNAEN